MIIDLRFPVKGAFCHKKKMKPNGIALLEMRETFSDVYAHILNLAWQVEKR